MVSQSWHGLAMDLTASPGRQRRRVTRPGQPGLCTISGLGEVSNETYPHRTTEGPERAPVA